MKLFPVLASALWLLASIPAYALIDTDSDGFGDAWESLNGFLIGASPPANQAPAADPDSDGWTNLQEATAGTNPFSATSPGGILVPAVAYAPAIREPAPPGSEIGQPALEPPPGDPNEPFVGGGGGGTYSNPLEIRRPARFTLTWQPVAGKAYCVYYSADLATWLPASGFFMGGSDPLTYQGEAINSDNTEPDKIFYRVKVEDADNDADTLTDYEETLLGTDPYSADTDRDGISDNLDPQPLVNSLAADPDGSGLPASLATGLLAKWDLEITYIAASQGPFYTLARYADTAGSYPIVPFHTETKADGMPSKAAGTTSAATGFLCPPRTLLHNRTTYSVSMWAKIEKGSISSLRPIAALFSHHRRLPKAAPYQAQYKIDINGIWIERLATGEQVLKAGTSGFINYVPGTNQQTNGTWSFAGVTSTAKPAGTLDDGKWHHFLAVRTSGTVTLYMDGEPIGTNGNVILADINATNETKTGISLGRYYGEPAEDGFPYTDPLATKASFDRVKVWSRTLTAAEALALYQQDLDKDGLWDITESRTRLWRDANSDAITQDSEQSFGSSPFQWQPVTNDTDGDGLTDIGEQTAGTGIGITDSDGDRLPDGYEAANNLNPLDANGQNGANGDPDGDGVINLDEYRYHTKPSQLTGDPPIPQPGSSWDSDGDGTQDGPEIAASSHPGDASDGGQPLAPEEKISVKLGIGDKSGSHSEDYSLAVAEIDPETGIENDIYTLHSQGYGQYRTETQGFFRKGRNYTFRIVWNGTNNSAQSNSSGTEGPDFDYTFEVQPQGADTGFLIDGYDPKHGRADLTKPLLAANASDVADTETEFKTNYQNRRVVLMGVSTLSKDRMFGASMQVLPGLEGIQLQITNSITNEDFGTHSQLFAKAYDNYEGILGYGDNFGRDVSDPRVWFIKDEVGVIQSYLCGNPAAAHGVIRIVGMLQGSGLGTVQHTLTPDADSAAFLGTATRIASGIGLGFPLQAGHTVNASPAAGMAHHWAGALAIPVMMVEHAVERQTLFLTGLVDGIVAGLMDDWNMVILIKDGLVIGGNWSIDRAEAFLTSWRTDPYARLQQVKDSITRFIQNNVCDMVKEQAAQLSTVQGLLDTVWNFSIFGVQQNIKHRIEDVVGGNPWVKLAEGIDDWFADFNERMLVGAEKGAWASEPFPTNPLVGGAEAFRRTFIYATGYGMGYLSEQVAVGVATGGGFTIAAILTKGGAKLAAGGITRLATRSIAVVAARGQILKKWGAGAVMSIEMRIALEDGFALAARAPTPGVSGGKNVLSVIEESYGALPSTNTTATIKHLVDAMVLNPRLAAQNLAPEGALRVLTATARLHSKLGATATEKAVRNWPKIANAIAVNGESGLADDFLRYADFEDAFMLDTPAGKQLAIDLLESIDTKTTADLIESGMPMPGSIKQLYPKMYHYADEETMLDYADDLVGGVDGQWKLWDNVRGRYISPELVGDHATVKSKFQLPLKEISEGVFVEVPTKGRFRFESLTSDVAGNYVTPRSNVHSGAVNSGKKNWLEILAKDNPSRGSGGGIQFVETEAGQGILFDTVTNQFVRDKLHLQELLDSNP